MDRKLKIETVSMVMLLVSFPTISIGATLDVAAVWAIGFAVFKVGALLPVITRFMDHSADAPRDAGLEFDERVS